MTNPQIDNRGNKRWCNESGQLHREDGPAIEYKNGTKYWYLNGQLHRQDGPAIRWATGDKYWFLNGKELSFNEWQKQIIIQNVKSLL